MFSLTVLLTACEVLSGNSCILNILEPFALSPLPSRSVNVSCALCTVPMQGAGSTSRPTSLTSVQTPGVVTPTGDVGLVTSCDTSLAPGVLTHGEGEASGTTLSSWFAMDRFVAFSCSVAIWASANSLWSFPAANSDRVRLCVALEHSW